MKYAYTAIFTEEGDGGYSVRFPDFESCYTCGDDLHVKKLSAVRYGRV
jgi:predicted RNase H-like HicB family nuclease